MPKPTAPGKRSRPKPNARRRTLAEYDRKRNFSKTPEPSSGETTSVEGAPRFVVQKHSARHLHYDFRLEMEGVLRSWAVPKGPPLKRGERRLAMHVEDHPLDYGTFEGIIPQGNYGAGTVMLWDTGAYEDLSGHPARAFYQGKLHIRLHGKKLSGEFALVKARGEEKNWYFIRVDKDLTISKSADDFSIASGRTLNQIAADKESSSAWSTGA